MAVYKIDYNSNSAYVQNLATDITDLSYKPLTITAGATLGSGYPIIEINVTAAPVTFNLATVAAFPNQTIYIRRIDPTVTGNIATIVPQAGYTIFGGASYVMNLPNQVILIYRDPVALDWKSLSFSVPSKLAIPVVTNAVSVGTSPGTIGYFPWTNATYSIYGTLRVSAWVAPSTIAGKDLTISLLPNGGAALGSVVVSAGGATGIYTFTFTAPGANMRLDLYVSRTGASANDPIIYGAAIELAP